MKFLLKGKIFDVCDTLSDRSEFCKILKQDLSKTGNEVKFKGA